ncbi:MAG: flagellar biosynthetic protein FliO [Anaerohalosphaera sp.]|nr:flagellar biosynthetic protein FliO [Anaerohalosphaera sp.]
MISSNTKIAIFALLLLAISSTVVLADQPDDTGKPPVNKPLPSQNSSNYQMLINTIKAILFVAVFGTAAIFITRKLAPRLAKSTGKSIHILENVSLGQRRSLHLIEIQGKKILLASSADNIVKLCELTTESLSDPVISEGQND